MGVGCIAPTAQLHRFQLIFCASHRFNLDRIYRRIVRYIIWAALWNLYVLGNFFDMYCAVWCNLSNRIMRWSMKNSVGGEYGLKVWWYSMTWYSIFSFFERMNQIIDQYGVVNNWVIREMVLVSYSWRFSLPYYVWKIYHKAKEDRQDMTRQYNKM